MEVDCEEAQERLESLIDLAIAGQEVIILLQGRRVAKLVPAKPLDKPRIDDDPVAG